MTIELDSVAANAPDNAEGATVRTARYAINAAHASGNITGEQHAEARDVGEESGMINAEAMNSVTEKKPTAAFYSHQGRNGWHPGAGPARPECRSHRSPTWLHSRHTQGALLTGWHQPARTQRGQGGAAGAAGARSHSPTPPKPPKQERSYAFAVPTTLQLSRVAMSRLRQRAEATGMTEAELVTSLLEVIAQDDLYDAVLDTAKGAA